MHLSQQTTIDVYVYRAMRKIQCFTHMRYAYVWVDFTCLTSMSAPCNFLRQHEKATKSVIPANTEANTQWAFNAWVLARPSPMICWSVMYGVFSHELRLALAA